MDVILKLNWIDVLAVIIILRISYISFQNGLSHEIFPLVVSIVSITLSLRYYNNIAVFIKHNMMNANIYILNLVVFICLIAILGIIGRFLRAILDVIIKVTWHPLIERFGGLIIGSMRSVIVTSMVLIAIALVPVSYLQWSIRDRSLTGMYFLRVGPAIYERLSVFLPAVKVEKAPVSGDAIVTELVSGKSISQAPAKAGKSTKDKSEWDRGG